MKNNKIIIFTHKGDQSSYLISMEIAKLGHIPVRVNKESDAVKILSFNSDTNELRFKINNSPEISSHEIQSIFFRGGYLRLAKYLDLPRFVANHTDEIEYYLSAFGAAQIDFLAWFFETKFRSLGKNGLGSFNKLVALSTAQSLGFRIPQTNVVTQKDQLFGILDTDNNDYVVKSLALNFDLLTDKDLSYLGYTRKITSADLHNVPDKFAPSLIQQLIDKKYEIRVFYLDKTIIPIAHFNTNKSDSGIVDYRDYDYNDMPRVSKVKLPDKVNNLIVKLMDALQLNTGSLDIIYSTDGNYYFLEVNPIGQFSYFSYHSCTYIEHKIAKYLCKI